jgi:hypothetical protein
MATLAFLTTHWEACQTLSNACPKTSGVSKKHTERSTSTQGGCTIEKNNCQFKHIQVTLGIFLIEISSIEQ